MYLFVAAGSGSGSGLQPARLIASRISKILISSDTKSMLMLVVFLSLALVPLQ